MKKKHLIVFDIDGTLTDSIVAHQQSFVKALHEIGVEQIDQNFGAYKHHTDSYIAKVIYEKDRGVAFSKEQIALFEERLMAHIQNYQIAEIAAARSVVDTLLSESEFAVCYATGSLLKPAEFKLQSIGLDFPSELLVASNEIYEREGIVRQAIAQASSFYHVNQFERIIAVGDGLWDLKTAKNLALEFIGIGNKNKTILATHGMTKHLETLEGFIGLIND